MPASEEMTVKELILEIRFFFAYVLKKWWVVALVVLLTIAGSFLYHQTVLPSYNAKLTYLVEGSSGGGSAILNQLGIGLGSGEGPNVQRIQEVAKSNQVGMAVLNRVVEIEGKVDRLGNFLIERSGLRESWRESLSPFAELSMQDSVPSDSSRLYASMHKALLELLYQSGGPGGDGLIGLSTDELTMIANINVSTEDEELSLKLANVAFDELQDFYVKKIQARQLDNIAVTKFLTDSLKRELDIVQSRISREEDRISRVVLSRDRLGLQRLRQDEQRIVATYAEAYKNLQLAEFNLRSQRPNIEVIDRPFAPIYGYVFPLPRLIMLSVIISSILIVGVLFLFYLGNKFTS